MASPNSTRRGRGCRNGQEPEDEPLPYEDEVHEKIKLLFRRAKSFNESESDREEPVQMRSSDFDFMDGFVQAKRPRIMEQFKGKPVGIMETRKSRFMEMKKPSPVEPGEAEYGIVSLGMTYEDDIQPLE